MNERGCIIADLTITRIGDDRFLGGESHGQETYRPLVLLEELALLVHQQALNEMVAETVVRLLDARQLDDVRADTVDHAEA